MKRVIVSALVALVLLGLLALCVFVAAPGMSAENPTGGEKGAQVQKTGEGDKAGGEAPRAENAVAAEVADGIYLAEGTQGGGKKKYGAVVGIKRTGDTYQVEWNSGGIVYAGIGIVEGDRLCVSCVMGGHPCVVVYKIEKNKVLSGRWAVTPGVVESEVLTYKQPLPQKKREGEDPAGAV